MPIRSQKPKLKKKCVICEKFSFIRSNWNYCMKCYEKKYGRYKGADRNLYI